MKPDEAEKLIGKSTSWIKGVDVSIKKWKELVESKEKRRDASEWSGLCGLCIVKKNRKGMFEDKQFSACAFLAPCKWYCPLKDLGSFCCKEFMDFYEHQTKANAKKMLNRLIKLREELLKKGFR